MSGNKLKLAICLAAAFLATGCGNKEQETAPTQEPEATPVVFAPIVSTITKQTEGLTEHLEKIDAAEQAQYNAMNRMFSEDETSHQSLFCIDADTGVVYFVNQNKDSYIYRIKDGVVELAVSIPARELYTYDGVLYFMAESYGKYTMEEMKDGDIYCYTPEDGKVELVYAFEEEVDRKTCKMLVNENGIYFFFEGAREEMAVDGRTLTRISYNDYYLPFGEKEAVSDGLKIARSPKWRDYNLGRFKSNEDTSAQRPPFALIRGTEEGIDYKELSVGSPRQYCVMEDSLYCYTESMQDAELIVLDLVTGERKEYCVWEGLKKVYSTLSGRAMAGEKVTELTDEELIGLFSQGSELYGSRMAECFTATKQHFWLASKSGSYLIRIDRESKEIAVFEVNGYVKMLYTDGEQPYGMYAPTYDGISSLARILITKQPVYNEETGEEIEEECVAVQYLTK